MNRRNLISVLFLLVMSSLSAQTFVGKLNANPTLDVKKYTSNDTLKILAVLADFPEDKDDATFGNGKFGSIYSEDYGDNILDPLPHDKAYFENHLEFVKNYFAKVSDGKLNISYTILDDILTVSQTMRNYTPPIDDLNDHTPLGNYLDEVWKLADNQYPNINFSEYDLFFIFHAGVGKDVSLPGSLGNERDLPSVYLNQKSLQNIFGDGFDGFSVNNGSFKITNSAILPETESRELTGFDGLTLIELTTNGLIAATVGSYLGLPDLYDTETGRSAIGRFGLMDGQAMFTYQGIFPPEPSAWEKMFLGWATPTEVSISNSKINLVNKYVANIGDTTLLKIPINSTEYYLIENRKRDANNDGSIVTYVSNGQTYTINFDRDYENYIYYNVDTLKGVIIDVDEFDWALPSGDRNTKIENFEDIGLIIWHIDERIIAENYETNTINNDRYKRGIAIVEADGIRDIGEEFNTIFGETIIGEGTKEDTWYKNNPADLYENKFSGDTNPKAVSNTGANSLITLSDFSEVSTSMSFNLAFGSDNIDYLANVEMPVSRVNWFSAVNDGDNSRLFAFTGEDITELYTTGNIKNRIEIMDYGFKPAVVKNDNGINVISNSYDVIELTQFDNNDGIDTVYLQLPERILSTSPVIYSQSGDVIEALIGTADGKIRKYSFNTGANKSISLIETIDVFDDVILNIAVNGNNIAAYSSGIFWSNGISPITLNETPMQILTTLDGAELKSILALETGFAVVKGGVVAYHNFDNPLLNKLSDVERATIYDKIILADIKNDGDNYVIKNDGNYFTSYNLNGVVAGNFPVMDEYEFEFYSSPLAVDLNNDEAADLIAFTVDGKILAIDGLTGKMIDGFPISCGGEIAINPVIYTANGRTALAVLTKEDRLLTWNISKYNGKKFWTEMNGNAGNNASAEAANADEKMTEFFPQSKAYNWPNPVYDGVTNIRYFVSEDSKTEVTIFDLAGDLVAKLSGTAIGGYDNEIVWNVSDIESGVYFAHLKVTGNSGKTDTKIIKIAVIK